MTTRWLLASLHLLALGVGLGAVWARGRSLSSTLGVAGLRSVLLADLWWGVAALLWISTGLWRLLAGLDKDTAYYFQNHLFLTKMALLAIVLGLEIRPMVTLTRWRRSLRAGEQPVTQTAPALARISFIQAWLVVLMVFLAAAMARGYGVSSQSHYQELRRTHGAAEHTSYHRRRAGCRSGHERHRRTDQRSPVG